MSANHYMLATYWQFHLCVWLAYYWLPWKPIKSKISASCSVLYALEWARVFVTFHVNHHHHHDILLEIDIHFWHISAVDVNYNRVLFAVFSERICVKSSRWYGAVFCDVFLWSVGCSLPSFSSLWWENFAQVNPFSPLQ